MVKVLQQRSSQRGGPFGKWPPPPPKYEIFGLECSEHTDGRVHFTGLIETVFDVSGYIWDPKARNSDFRSGRETTKSKVRQPKLCGDLCHSTLDSKSTGRLIKWAEHKIPETGRLNWAVD